MCNVTLFALTEIVAKMKWLFIKKEVTEREKMGEH
jgi:hypothetical protein